MQWGVGFTGNICLYTDLIEKKKMKEFDALPSSIVDARLCTNTKLTIECERLKVKKGKLLTMLDSKQLG